MEKRLQAVYKDGVLQPLEPVSLEDRQQVTVTISDTAEVGQDVKGYFTPEEWSKAEDDDISLEQVRQALSTISGSLSEAVIARREER
ncbi:MAG TPA: antitoxin family protein [Bryobacteraceae bacterium]